MLFLIASMCRSLYYRKLGHDIYLPHCLKIVSSGLMECLAVSSGSWRNFGMVVLRSEEKLLKSRRYLT